MIPIIEVSVFVYISQKKIIFRIIVFKTGDLKKFDVTSARFKFLFFIKDSQIPVSNAFDYFD